MSTQATSDAKFIDKQDDHEGVLDIYSNTEKSKTSPSGRDMVSVTPWTDANMSRDSLKPRPGTSQKPERDFTTSGHNTVTNGHHYDSVLGRNIIQQNGFESPSDKDSSAGIYRDVRQNQYEHDIHRERPKNFETAMVQDFLSQGKEGRTESDVRHCEARKIKDLSPMGAKDCNKTQNSHSEVTKIVPLKPQRSKKSLNKENKGVNPQTQSWSDSGVFGATRDAQMTESKGRSCEAGRRVDDYTVLQSATDVVKENTGAAKYQSEATVSYPQQTFLHHQPSKEEMLGQQEMTYSRGTMGHSQWMDHFQNSSDFKENIPSGSKFPTAPPRSLPLKTQWNRDRQSNMDNSHIHYRTASQETANKRKQAVTHQPPLTCLFIIGK